MGLSHGHLPDTPIHAAHQKVKMEMNGLMGYERRRFERICP